MAEAPNEPVSLWPGRPRPDVSIRLADTDRPGGAVMVCPGGGYGHLAIDHEGHDVVAALLAADFDTALLRYRLGPHNHHPAMIHDAVRGMRLFRRTLDDADRPTRCAVLGFSAGGHLAATLAVHPETFTSEDDDLAGEIPARPDAAVLCYPVVDMGGRSAHLGSRRNLLGDEPDEAMIEQLSPHLHVNTQTPPTFLWHTFADTAVPAEHSLAFARACREHRVPCELHLYENGAHGLGLAPDDAAVATWFPLALAFLRRHLAPVPTPPCETHA